MLRVRSMLICLAAVAASPLGGCGTDHVRELRDERDAVFPANYRTEIVAFMKSYLNDPGNVRDAYIAEPVRKPFDTRERYVVCVRYNARNSEGRYAGSKDGMALFNDGRFDRLVEQSANRPLVQCADADYKPFPELQALKR